MACSRVIIALFFSLFLISQVSSQYNSNEETSHVGRPLHVFNSGGDTKLMHSIEPRVVSSLVQHCPNGVLHLSKYFRNPITAGSLALAPAPAPALAPTPVHPVDCTGLCKNRCSLHSRLNLCIRACGTCCARCKCVPPGTSGNREVCGKCYTDMTTHHNRTKCP